ncbi:hypothetical protein JG687_00012678, partial [Phytophthora cactorum]
RERGDDGDSDCNLADLELEKPVAAEGTEVAQLQNDQHDNRESLNESPSATLRCKNQEGASDDLQLDINVDLDGLCVTNPSQVSLPDMIERSHELFQQEVIADTSSPYEADLATNKGKQLEAKESIVTNLDVLNLQAPSKARGKVSTKGKWSVKEFQSNCPRDTQNDYELVDVGPDGDVQRLTWFQKWAASPCK